MSSPERAVADVWRAWHGVSELPPVPPLLWLGRQERLRSTWPELARALDALQHPLPQEHT